MCWNFGKIEVELVTITPDIAEEWLDRNIENRKRKEASIPKYARDMKSNKWLLNGSTIVFDSNGNLRDGQNRLRACVRVQTPFVSLVVKGVSPYSQMTMDTGVTRTFSDVLKLNGETNVTELASGVGVVISILNGYKSSNTVPSMQERVMFLSNHPRVRESASKSHAFSKASEIKARNLVSKSQITALHYLFTLASETLGQPEAADIFFESLALKHPEYLNEGSPFLATRQWIERSTKNASQLFPKDKTAVLIKAWNSWMIGRPMHQMKWTSGGPKAEPYPQIFGLAKNITVV